MHTVEIHSLEISDSGRISVEISSAASTQTLTFGVPGGSHFHTDTIGAAIALLLAKYYSRIRYTFPLSDTMRKYVERYCQAAVETSGTCAPEARCPNGLTGLAFSGGFDSLAARDFLPGAPALISLDFGGRFSRERHMFETFNSTVIQTNLVDLGLNRNSWAFMAVGNTLMRNTLGLSSLSFGTVLEAREKYILRFLSQRHPDSKVLTDLTGMPILNPLLGLTEVATAQYVTATYPELVEDILSSVANPGEEKSYRKSLLVEVAKGRLGMTCPPRLSPPAKPQFRWGDRLALDFLAVYLVKHVGLDAVQLAYDSSLPEAIERLADELQLTFYERVNPNFYMQAPPRLVAGIFSNLISNGVFPYTNTDFNEFSRVSSFLFSTRR